MAYGTWLQVCDWIAAYWTGGMMTDDLAYDWRASWEWGDDPVRAVIAATRDVHEA